jgi:hypothetical protein
MTILVGRTTLTKNPDLSLSCSFTAQYTTLPISVPDPGIMDYKIIAFLTCASGSVQFDCIEPTDRIIHDYHLEFGALEGEHVTFTTTQDPPPGNQLTGTASLQPPASCPANDTPQIRSVTYTTLALKLEEYRTGIIQVEEILDWQNITV